VAFSEYDLNILQNVYENLVFFNGSCSTCVIPWLAQSYTVSPDLSVYNFTLRGNITFQDGTPLNSTAVYFSLNRVLMEDSSTPTSHATQASWLFQQVLNTSLSSVLCCPQSYGSSFVNAVLGENFVQVTGPLTFSLHASNPSVAFPYILAGVWGGILSPEWTMQHDLAIWNASGSGYTLPFPSLSGNLTQQINQYFQDLSATCNSGSTPSGCGATYLDTSFQGSAAGTGPYILQSFSQSSNNVMLESNPHYWGGPYQFAGGSRITPKISTVEFKYVPSQTTREIDLKNAASSGEAMAIDVADSNLYDVADRNSWLNSNSLTSIIPSVSIYGPYDFYGTLFDPFGTNVTNSQTGTFYTFQPFADLRFRLAFADSVNMTDIGISVGNKLAPVALNVVPPGIPPAGAFNSSITPAYSFNPDMAAQLLLQAMSSPLTKFTFTNGSAAAAGLFNNTFGCTSLGSNHQCSKPVAQSISLYFQTGDTVDQAIFQQIATTINNISSTYNMGLTVEVVPIPLGELTTEAFTTPTYFYMYSLGYEQDYPWVLDFLGPMFAPGQSYTNPDGWNVTQMSVLFQEAVSANSAGNTTGLIEISNQMNQLANSMAMYLWTFNTINFITMTSNVHGFYYNPSLNPAGPGGVGPEYFATLY